MIVSERNMALFLMFITLLGLLIGIGVLLYVITTVVMTLIFHKKSNEIIKQYLNDKNDKILDYLLKIAFLCILCGMAGTIAIILRYIHCNSPL